MDGFETIEFANKTTLTINALAGSDTINLSNPITPTGLTGITVNGGDPIGSDTLFVNGIAGSADDLIVTPTGAGAGSISDVVAAFVPVTFSGTELLSVIGQTADADGFRVLGTSGNDNYSFTGNHRRRRAITDRE